MNKFTATRATQFQLPAFAFTGAAGSHPLPHQRCIQQVRLQVDRLLVASFQIIFSVS